MNVEEPKSVAGIADIDWNALSARLEPPDAYHSRREAGATKHTIGFGMYEVPAGNETWWSTFDANCWYGLYSSDVYHFETLVLSHARCIHAVAVKFLVKRQVRFRELYAKNQIDTFGADLFAEGLLGAVEAVKRRPCFDDIGPDGTDELEQLKRYISRAARNKMVDYFKQMYSKRWCQALRKTNPNDGELLDERGNKLFHEYDAVAELIDLETNSPLAQEAALRRAQTAIEAAYTCDTDRTIVELRRNFRLSQEEIGQKLGLSRDQVQRTLARILRTTEQLLGLKSGKTKMRKKRSQATSLKS